MRGPARIGALLALASAATASASAADLVITKTSAIVSDAVNSANFKALPGALVDYALVVRNPNTAALGTTFGSVRIEDTIPSRTVFQTGNYPGSNGPIEFADGSLLGTGLLDSGLSYSFKGLADDTDGVDFSNGTNWGYHPKSGSDPAVKAIRVTLTGTQRAASAFRLRFRVMLS